METPEVIDGVKRLKMAKALAGRKLTRNDNLHLASNFTEEMRRVVLAAQKADLENGRIDRSK